MMDSHKVKVSVVIFYDYTYNVYIFLCLQNMKKRNANE